MAKKLKVEVVRGVHGHMAVYLGDHRIAGSKPWGGGEVIHSFNTTADEIKKALEFHSL